MHDGIWLLAPEATTCTLLCGNMVLGPLTTPLLGPCVLPFSSRRGATCMKQVTALQVGYATTLAADHGTQPGCRHSAIACSYNINMFWMHG